MDVYVALRRDASMLLEHGHSDAYAYAIARVWSEAKIVRDRIAERVQLDAVAMHTVIVQALSGGKHLEKFLKELRDG
jgi:hypothetical protein